MVRRWRSWRAPGVRTRFQRARRLRRRAARARRRRLELRTQRAEARRAQQSGDLAALVQSRARIAELRPRRARHHYRLGRALERSGRLDEARAAYREGLRLDPRALPVEHLLLDAKVRRFLSRRRLARFVEANLEPITAATRSGTPAPRRPDQVHVFVYWAQGFDAAPPVVRLCRDQLLRLHAPGVVVCLDDSCLHEWTDLPPDVVRAGAERLTQYSDLVRVALLAEHGGIWVDATVLVTCELTGLFDRLTPGGFFAPSYRPGGIASWVMASVQHGHVVTTMRAAEIAYWRAARPPAAYFKFHQMFESMYLRDPRFAASVDAMPVVQPHLWRLFRFMREPYAPKRLRRMLAVSFIHKLTYKRKGATVDPATESGTNLAHLLAHGVPDHPPFDWDAAVIAAPRDGGR